jgi:hypothetical protein
MVARLAARERRGHTDDALHERALRLAERYLAEHPQAAQAVEREMGSQPKRSLGLVYPGRPEHPDLDADPESFRIGWLIT